MNIDFHAIYCSERQLPACSRQCCLTNSLHLIVLREVSYTKHMYTKNKLAIFLLLLSAVASTAGCKLGTALPEKEEVMRIQLRKDACFGECPVFTLTIYSTGRATYAGEHYTPLLGLHETQLADDRYKSLVAAFADANLFDLPSLYKSEIPDLPVVMLRYVDERGEMKEIMGRENRPEVVMELEGMLDAFIDEASWKQVISKDTGLPVGTITNQIIVELAPDIDPQVWKQAYTKQQLEILEQVAPSQPLWLVTFDENKMTGTEMLAFLRKDPNVFRAEFNKQVWGR